MNVGDGTRGRVDNRRRHDGVTPQAASGPVHSLTPEEIANMDPSKPTPKRILVDQLPRETKSIDDALQQAAEIAITTIGIYHTKAKRELELLDDKALQTVNTATTILVRIKRLGDDAPLDPKDMTDEEIERRLSGK